MLSGWERDRHVTSPRYRRILAGFYKQPPETLFAHQDQRLTTAAETPRLLVGHQDLQDAMTEVVRHANQCLVVTGSRSRDAGYLRAIEDALAEKPDVVHYRVLFGPPHHEVLREHLLRLLELRDPADRSHGVKTLHIGIVEDLVDAPERFICASETSAVVPVPSLTSMAAFDSGTAFAGEVAGRLIDHVRQVYAGSRRIETPQAVRDLPVVRS
jgi:hypothetical protein